MFIPGGPIYIRTLMNRNDYDLKDTSQTKEQISVDFSMFLHE